MVLLVFRPKTNIKFHQQAGFTLVELAIVLVVVGLLIGGILKGSEMITHASMMRTKADIESFQVAYQQFRDMYKAIPGDFNRAESYLPNCNPPNCVNGNGNGIIGSPSANGTTDQTGAGTPQVETTMFFKHLLLAGLITGVTAASDPSVPEIGGTHPKTPLGGAYSAYYRQGWHGISIKGCPQNSACERGILSPARAQLLDIAIDGESDAGKGRVIANGGGCNHTAGTYDLSTKSPCYILITLGR